jgi:hypothetical protein
VCHGDTKGSRPDECGVTPVKIQSDGFHYADTRESRNLLTVVQRHPGVAMNPSVKILFNRIAMLVVVTLAVAAVFDWSGLSS